MTIKGTTASGFEFEVDKALFDNMELVDALAELADGDGLAISRVAGVLFSKEQKKRLYDHLRDESGRVPVKAFSNELMDIMRAAKDDGKN